MNLLVCGGAGYIGAHVVRALDRDGHRVTVLDDFSTGHEVAVASYAVEQVSVLDPQGLSNVFARQSFDAVVHLCARSLVAESVARPYDYFRQNVVGALNLLEAMQAHGVTRIVFSSSAAIFGVPQQALIDETHPVQPINPYGASKAMVEWMLRDAVQACGLRSVSLRYFNAAGADEAADIGESHSPETHLVPNAIKAVLNGEAVQVFGNDYATPDGTCVRDYVHVSDLADAHVRALAYLDKHPGAHRFNLGSGRGFSVLEVVEAVRTVAGVALPIEVVARRAGDPEVLVASGVLATEQLGWRPRFTDINAIVETAWRWHRNPRY